MAPVEAGSPTDSESTNAQSLTLTGTTVTGNTSLNNGGGVLIFGDATLNDVVDISGSTISDNTVADEEDGAGISQEAESTLTVSNSTISGNGPTEGADIDGGGAYLEGTGSADTFTDDTIDGDNQAYSGAGVYIYNVDPTFSGGTISGNTAASDGGGVDVESGTSTFSGVTITNNTADSEGGGVYVDGGTNSFTDGTIDDDTAGVANTDNGYGGGVYINDGTNTFADDTVDGNDAVWVSGNTGYGGGLDVVGGTNTFTGGSIDGNGAYVGGGLYLENSIALSQVDISSNTASEAGGGIFDWSDGELETVTQSTISDNQVPTHAIGATSYLGDGGGILSNYCQNMAFTNDTITGNSAPNLGGGFFSTDCSQPSGISTTFEFDTISGNTSGSGGGNISTDDLSELGIAKSIVANGVSGGVAGTNCTFSDGGTLTSQGYNLIDDSTCGTPAATDIIGKSAGLGTLGNNGGPTQTLLPASSSPAVGAVPSATCSSSGVSTDQRGEPRGGRQRLVHHRGRRGGAGDSTAAALLQPQRLPPGGRRGRDLRLRAQLQRLAGQQQAQRPHRRPGQLARTQRLRDGGRRRRGLRRGRGELLRLARGPVHPLAHRGHRRPAQRERATGWPPRTARSTTSARCRPCPRSSSPRGPRSWAWPLTPPGRAPGWSTSTATSSPRATPSTRAVSPGTSTPPSWASRPPPAGQGYILVASDGGVFNYGVGFHGSVPGSLAAGQQLVAPIVGIAVTHSGNGYWEVGADGGVFNYGDAPFLGSIYTAIPGQKLNGPIVGIQHLGSAPA